MSRTTNSAEVEKNSRPFTATPVLLIPVIDLKNHQAVHAVAGQRDAYQPVRSVLCDTAEPREVATALARRVGHKTLYVADLDALQTSSTRHRPIIQQLLADGFEVWLDAGVKRVSDAKELATIDSAGYRLSQIIVALESVESQEELHAIVRQLDAQRLVFSMDLKAGQISANEFWKGQSPLEILQQVTSVGIRNVILLDVAAVGVGQGVITLDLCRQAREQFPDVQLVSGGGVRGADDVQRLADAGCQGALVATALHRGAL